MSRKGSSARSAKRLGPAKRTPSKPALAPSGPMGGAGSTPLATFASEVIARARQVQAQAQARDDENGGLWGRHKVFISEIGTSAEFKESLLNAHRQGLLRLTRLDMSPMLSSAQKEMVGKGEIRHMNGLFHVIDLE